MSLVPDAITVRVHGHGLAHTSALSKCAELLCEFLPQLPCRALSKYGNHFPTISRRKAGQPNFERLLCHPTLSTAGHLATVTQESRQEVGHRRGEIDMLAQNALY
jgi:hypothetical protein